MFSFISRSRVVATLVAILCIVTPLAALACPNCYGSSKPEVINSYLMTAALMTALPFTMFAGLFGLFAHLRRQAQAARDAATIEAAKG